MDCASMLPLLKSTPRRRSPKVMLNQNRVLTHLGSQTGVWELEKLGIKFF
ncbi:MAG: hypothetical protein ACTSWR_11190 [Candidatus Helarchaeota archaeon]